ncbi:MAG: helix-turn-helix domain-containing protein [Candidatus Altiarchaeota archaeon]
MALPCEEAIWYTLPRIRADLARELVKNGMRQKDVARVLDITPSAVSQYLHKKRGGGGRMPAGYREMIAKAAVEISADSSDDVVSRLICRCCRNAAKHV